MEFIREGQGKSWKSNNIIILLSENKKIIDNSETGSTFRENRHKHTFYALQCWKIHLLHDCVDTTVRAAA